MLYLFKKLVFLERAEVTCEQMSMWGAADYAV